MMNVRFVDLKAQYLEIREEIDEVIQAVIEESAFINGPYLKAFERDFADYLGVKHCIGVGNGTDALFVALKVLGVKEGDEIITVANSFIATSEAISLCGGKVVFVDCRPNTYNIDVDKIESYINRKTKGIIPVHLYGQPAEMDAILDIADKYDLFVVEDAAQAHGAKYKGKMTGGLADCACFSFFPGKNLGAYGDGGAVVTNDETLARKVSMTANHGRMKKFFHEFEGCNSRLDGLQAAILGVKLKHLDRWNQRRREIAARYDKAFHEVAEIPEVREDVEHVYHLYVIRVPNRDKIRVMLSERGIATGIHYPVPLPFLKAYDYLEIRPSDYPVSSRLKDEILSLPIHGSMMDQEVDYVIQQVFDILKSEGS
jgi:dTDP-4-amino-4,6-dideoxygalactose transaminase